MNDIATLDAFLPSGRHSACEIAIEMKISRHKQTKLNHNCIMRIVCWFLYPIACLAIATVPLHADFVQGYFPAELTKRDGYGSDYLTIQHSHLQQRMDASMFMEAIPQGGVISLFGFRADVRNGGAFITRVSGVSLSFGTVTDSEDPLSPIYAENTRRFSSSTSQVVRPSDSSLYILSAAPGPRLVGDTLMFNLSSGYFYDPRKGDLYIDLEVESPGIAGLFDFDSVDGLGIESVFTTDFGTGTALTRGNYARGGFIPYIRFEIVPEPSPVVLGGLSGVALAALRGVSKRREKGR